MKSTLHIIYNTCTYVSIKIKNINYRCRTVKQIKGHNFEGDSPVFGINAGLFVSGKIKIGDPVYINY